MSKATEFGTLDLKHALSSRLAEIAYTKMTPVQARALPPTLAGMDVIARARTGTGKTAAFGLGLLNKLDAANFGIQALVLCPTRELADQVAREIRRLAQAIPNIKIMSLCGGVPIGPQNVSLQHSPHVIVGTPGRVLNHLGRGTVDLSGLQTLVLDEADRMLDMGFADELDAILAFVPKDRQTLLFSATFPESIASMSSRVQRNPVHVDVAEGNAPTLIQQYWFTVSSENRDDALLGALRAWGGALNLVFCNTKLDCIRVANYLQKMNIAAVTMHGDLDQSQRTETLVRFSNRSASVLIATDVAARGLDVDDLDVVINYELPSQPDVYIHRIGRTGRAGKTGRAISLVASRELRRLQDIEALLPDGVLQACAAAESKRTTASLSPSMTTIRISGGRKQKLRAGDLLGALTAKGGIRGDSVGSIDLLENCSYVAVRNEEAGAALKQLGSRPIKGRKYRARLLR